MERAAHHSSQHSAVQASISGGRGPLAVGLRAPPRGRRAPRIPQALPELAGLDLDALSSSLSHMLTLGYEPLVLPCSSMNCGDIVYRSTLDPTLRMETKGINPQGVALLGAVFAYLLAKPGVLQGWVDTYIQAPLQRAISRPYTRDDFAMGKKIATGGFGTVYKADLVDPDSGVSEPVIVKKATEFGEAEVWMNERMMRVSPQSAARFITAFADGEAKEGAPLWLAWAYEGDYTLAQLMTAKDFPANLEPLLFERPLNVPAGAERRAVVLRLAMQQLLEAVNACHSVGIVHRDVKPQNSIVSGTERRVKLIDFGAAADLRVGINYVPNQYLLDPRYAPPEQYVMPESTPRAPPAPVAAFLSPVLWRLNSPDRFDMYSVGVTLLQLALPPLRNDNGLIAFKRALRDTYKYDLEAWRAATEKAASGRSYAEGFATLDAFGGGGWDLAKKLVRPEPAGRLSAAAALAHPWFDPSPLGAVASTVEGLGRAAASSLADVDDGWLQKQIVRSGTQEVGGFTETQLREELGGETVAGRRPVPQASATIAWWMERQSDAQARLRDRRLAAKNARNTSALLGNLKLPLLGGGGDNGNSNGAAPAAPAKPLQAKKKAGKGGGGLIGAVGIKRPAK